MSRARISQLKANKRGIEALMKSPQMQAGLAEAANKTAASACMAASGFAKTPPRMAPYKGHSKVLSHTAVGVVRPTTKQGKAIEAKHHILAQFGGTQ